MIRVLRHAGVRLWLLLLWGVPLGFWLLPRALDWLPEMSAGMAMAVFLVAGGLGQGMVLDLIGRKRVRGLIREGELWEQAGLRSRAETRYVRAVRLLDSALVSPWFTSGLSKKLTRAMAGFYLSGAVSYPGFREAAARYLLYAPGDETLALLWLERYTADLGEGRTDRLAGPVLTLLAQTHHDHPGIAMKLAIPFLNQERNDFPARNLYRSLLRYLESHASQMDALKFPRAHLRKMAAMIRPEPPLGRKELPPDEAAVQVAEETETGATLGDRIAYPDYPARRSRRKPSVSPVQAAGRVLSGAMGLGGSVLLFFGRLITGIFTGGFRLGQDMVTAFLEQERLRKYVRYLLVSAVSVGLGVFLWGTMAHMLKSTGRDQVVHPVGHPAEGPYTIQVAAYLKQDHAERYVEKLSAMGVKAHMKKTEGGGKIWFLVRISYFKAKEDAADFGRQLKAQGKIEDFFVSNR